MGNYGLVRGLEGGEESWRLEDSGLPPQTSSRRVESLLYKNARLYEEYYGAKKDKTSRLEHCGIFRIRL